MKTIIACGMHRSGTSLLSGLLHAFGVNLGKNLMEADDANPLGYFENIDFVRMNNTLLTDCVAHWNYLPDVKKLKSAGEARAVEMTNMIAENESELWGWKDNRTMITFKCWEPHLKDKNLHIIWINRQKQDVIKSLKRTHIGQFNKEHRNDEYLSMLIDAHYSRFKTAIYGTDDLPKYPLLNLQFEDFFTKKKNRAIQQIIDFVGAGTIEQGLEFLRPDLKDQ